MRSVLFGLCSMRLFLFFYFLLFSFSIGIFLDRHWRFISRVERRNNYFSCSPLPPANKYSFNSLRFLPLIFTRSICYYQADSWWDMHYLDICILFALLWMQLSRIYWLWHFKVTLWGVEFISNDNLSYVICMSLAMSHVTRHVCMSSVCHSYVLACHPYVTRMRFYHEPSINNNAIVYYVNSIYLFSRRKQEKKFLNYFFD